MDKIAELVLKKTIGKISDRKISPDDFVNITGVIVETLQEKTTGMSGRGLAKKEVAIEVFKLLLQQGDFLTDKDSQAAAEFIWAVMPLLVDTLKKISRSIANEMEGCGCW